MDKPNYTSNPGDINIKHTDFEISENFTAAPVKFNIVHDYIKDKTPVQRPSLQPPLEPTVIQPNIGMRQVHSIASKTFSKEKDEFPKEKKEVRFQNIIENHGNFLNVPKEIIKTSENNNKEDFEKKEENKDAGDFLNSNDEIKHHRKKEIKNKTVIISANEKEVEKETQTTQVQKETEVKSPDSEKRIKSNTFSSPEKRKKEPRNSKLLAFSKIVDPLDKIDQENQQNLDLLANKQKLIFSNEDFMEEKNQKYLTFNKMKLEDLKTKIHEQDNHLGKFTCITVKFPNSFFFLK